MLTMLQSCAKKDALMEASDLLEEQLSMKAVWKFA
jgi:hypothetical protein